MSSSSERVSEWLNSITEPSDLDLQHTTFDTFYQKRKLQHMEGEEMPPAKRTRLDALHSGLGLAGSPALPAQSSRSCQLTSLRSASPSKRRRALAIQYSGPILRDVGFDEVTDWRAARTGEVPLLDDLFSCMANTKDVEQELSSNPGLTSIHQEVKRCLRRNANEDSWSDWVVLPSLKLARESSQQRQVVDIINVKSIDIEPTTLVSGPYKKRIDYSLGLEVANIDIFIHIQKSAEDYTISQSDHWLLNDRALFSHLEIKAQPDLPTAESQHKVWCVAGFWKQERLYWQARCEDSMAARLAPQPLWIWEKNYVRLIIAVMDLKEDMIYFLHPKTFFIDEVDPKSLGPVIGMMVKIIDWGYTHYLPWFRELIGEQT